MEEVDADLLAQRNRGAEAQRLLDHDLFRSAVHAVRERTLQRLLGAAPEDDRQRLHCQVTLQVLNDVLANLRRFVETGKLAEAAADRKNARRRAA